MKKVYLCVAAAIAMSGCGDKAKSVAYYREHINEAEATSKQCKRKKVNEVSAMSPSQQAAWNESAEGINCRNVDTVLGEKKSNDYQRKMDETVQKYTNKAK